MVNRIAIMDSLFLLRAFRELFKACIWLYYLSNLYFTSLQQLMFGGMIGFKFWEGGFWVFCQIFDPVKVIMLAVSLALWSSCTIKLYKRLFSRKVKEIAEHEIILYSRLLDRRIWKCKSRAYSISPMLHFPSQPYSILIMIKFPAQDWQGSQFACSDCDCSQDFIFLPHQIQSGNKAKWGLSFKILIIRLVWLERRTTQFKDLVIFKI